MAKVQHISGISKRIPFEDLDFYDLFRITFESSELGRMKRLLPLHEMAVNFGLVCKRPERKRGPKPFFSPEGKVALMFRVTGGQARCYIDELRVFVADPLPKTIQILDFDDGKVNLTDDEVKEFLSNTFGLKQTTDLQLYNRERRNDILREAKQYGASIRQLVRLTGISFAIVRDA